MSAAATAAGYLYASGRLTRRRDEKLRLERELVASSPCEGTDKDWTEDQKREFNKALGEAFGWPEDACQVPARRPPAVTYRARRKFEK
jgi:hypothetical protein